MLHASPVQLATIQVLVDIAATLGINIVYDIQSALVLGMDTINTPISPTQWITEITAWESYVWAAFQTYVSDYAIGPGARAAEVEEYTIKPNSTGYDQLCKVQRMRKTGSFV
jgi:hypothetical protein